MKKQWRRSRLWFLAALMLFTTLTLLAEAQPSFAAFPGTNGKIVFDKSVGGNEDIYVMDADGSNVTRLTTDPAADQYPSWSPDGLKIVFNSNRDGNFEIYMMNADGTNQTRLTNNSALDAGPTWAADGSKILFYSQRDANDEIYVMNADGTNQINLSNNTASDVNAVWSPDGSKIAFESTRVGLAQVFTMNTDGTTVTQLTSSGRNGGPNWSPDGTQIAFHTDRHGNPNYEIYKMNADGTSQARLTNNPGPDVSPAWSPDGLNIAFLSTPSNQEIFVMQEDGSGQSNLTNTVENESTPDWGILPFQYNFSGFFQPVDNLPTLNTVKAGSAVPVKFSLGGDQGLDIFAAGYPTSTTTTCGSTATDAVEQTVTAGSSSLSYDSTTDQYTYVWKTNKTWTNTCRTLIVKLNDNTVHRADFKFK